MKRYSSLRYVFLIGLVLAAGVASCGYKADLYRPPPESPEDDARTGPDGDK